MAEKYLTPEQVAERLSVSPKSVRKWLRADKLKGLRLGRRWRVAEDELRHFLFQRQAEEPSGQPKTPRISALGLLAGTPGSVEDFLREKHAETDREERNRGQPRPRMKAADLMGVLSGSSRTVEDFMREKWEEVEEDERRRRERQAK